MASVDMPILKLYAVAVQVIVGGKFMSLNIRNPRTEQLAKHVVRETGPHQR
jgi:hypothetical protein